MSDDTGRAPHDELAIDPEMVAAMCRSFITSHVASTGAEREDTVLIVFDDRGERYVTNDDASDQSLCSRASAVLEPGSYLVCTEEAGLDRAIAGVVVSGTATPFTGPLIAAGQNCIRGDDQSLCDVDAGLRCLSATGDGVRTCVVPSVVALGQGCVPGSESAVCTGQLDCLSNGTAPVCGTAVNAGLNASCVVGSAIDNCARPLGCVAGTCVEIPGERCELPISLTGTAGTTIGDSTSFANDYAFGLFQDACTGHRTNGHDTVYAIDVPGGSTLAVVVTSTADLGVYLTASCPFTDVGQCLAGNDVNPEPSATAFRPITDTAMFIIVDAFSAAGTYTLDWSITP